MGCDDGPLTDDLIKEVLDSDFGKEELIAYNVLVYV